MTNRVQEYFRQIRELLDTVEVFDKSRKELDFQQSILDTAGFILERTSKNKKLMFIGNGASAAISSHLSADFWKNGGIRATAFNDSSGLTCVSNDFGYKYVFEKPIEMFADPGDVLIAISSSGQSENILRGVDAARKKSVDVITLSGFDHNNPLKSLGNYNFYVPSSKYGHVEILHHTICHCLLDTILMTKSTL